MDKYNLIDSFPSSLAKYQVSLIDETLNGSELNPCRVQYERENLNKSESAESIVERLAFDKTEKLRLFLDAKNHLFNSRRVDSSKLANYLKSKYSYDPPKVRDFRDDKNSLFIMLFYETYNSEDNSIDMDNFIEARCASHRFKDKRDRMATVDDYIDIEDMTSEFSKFERIMLSDSKTTKIDWYHRESTSEITILFRQEDSRDIIPNFDDREVEDVQDLSLSYQERYPVRESAIHISNDEEEANISFYTSVSSWENTLKTFFTTTVGKDYTDKIRKISSEKTKQIMKEVKKETSDESVDEEVAGNSVESTVIGRIQQEADSVEEDSNIDTEFVKSRVNKMTVTGVNIENGDTTFEFHSEDGIKSILDNYEGMASSLAQTVKSADANEITIHASVQNDSQEDDEVVLENGEWYMSSGANESTIKALEKIL